MRPSRSLPRSVLTALRILPCTRRFSHTARLQSLVAPEEPLTPSLLYVGVATLTGSVLARNRGLLARATLPPTLLLLAFNHFLPQTAHNVSSYLGALEDAYAPALAEKHATANAHSAMAWAMAKERTADARARVGAAAVRGVDAVQDATGLKIREALGVGRAQAAGVFARVAERAREGAAVAERKAGEAREGVERKVEEVRAAVDARVEEAQRVVEEKVEEVRVEERVQEEKKADARRLV